MRIGLTNPYCWPYVRRGAERFLEELACFLTGRGHEVLTVSSKPGRLLREEGPCGPRVLHRQYWSPALGRLRIQPFHSFWFSAYQTLARERLDIVQSMFFYDAHASVVSGRRRKRPTIYYVAGPPIPNVQPRFPPNRWVLEQAVRGADLVLAPSRFVQQTIARHYGRRAVIAAAPLDVTKFRPPADRAPRTRPILLMVADFNDPNKGLRLLLDTFPLIRRRHPDALLRLSGHIASAFQNELQQNLPANLTAAVEFLGVGRLEDLPRLYAEASVTVLPSVGEAYGLVLLESWACGSPVVVTDDGGMPELVDDDRLGTLFRLGEPRATQEALAAAVDRGLELAERPETAQLCRERAARYDWQQLGPNFERIYRQALGVSA